LRPIGRPAFEDEAAIAIAAVNEADLVVDLVIDARVTQRGVDLAGAVAMNAVALGSKNFRRRLHGISP
jgi:hypothetical protein